MALYIRYEPTGFGGSSAGPDFHIGPLDSQPANANGLTLVGTVLSTQSADATHPGMVNNTTQTFSGAKTMTSLLTLNGVGKVLEFTGTTPYQSFVLNGTGNFMGSSAGIIAGGLNTDLAIRAQNNLILGIGNTQKFSLSSTDATFLTHVTIDHPTLPLLTFNLNGSPIGALINGASAFSGTQTTDLAINGNATGTNKLRFGNGGVLALTIDNGNSTFSGTIAASNFSGSSSGTNTGDVTLAAFGSVPNANAASLSGQVLTLQPADGTFPGGVSTTTQSFAGNKTFNNNLIINNATIPFARWQLSGSDIGGIINGSSAFSGTQSTDFAINGNATGTNKVRIGNGGVLALTIDNGVSTFSGNIIGTTETLSGQLTSTVSTGTAPFVVASTTQVANLNAATAGSAGSFSGSLSGDVTGTQSATVVSKIAGTTVSGTTGTGNVVFSNSPTLVTPALGTPSALVGTNITGTAAGLTAGTVTTNANLTGPITSVGNATSVASQTGTGSTFVMSVAPTVTGLTIDHPTLPLLTIARNGSALGGLTNGASAFSGGQLTDLAINGNATGTNKVLLGNGGVLALTIDNGVSTFSGNIVGTTETLSGQLTSTVSTGTAPFVVASTTQVANLNAATAGSATTATTATNANNVATTLTSTNASFFPTFVASTTNSNQAIDVATGLSFNPSTNNLTTTTFTGALSGNATTATTATNANNVATTAVTTNATFFPLFVASSSNSNQAVDLGTGLTFNPSTNNLTTTTFTGALSGNATTSTTSTNFSGSLAGDITGTQGATVVSKIAGTTVSGTTGTGNVVFSNSPTLVTPALGTPSALVGTNITGTAAGLTAGTVTTNANLTGDITSVGNATTAAATQPNIVTLSKATGVAVHGTNTNDNAAAGFVGEFASQNVVTPVSPSASGTYVDVTSFSLTAGDWDVSATVHLSTGATTAGVTQYRVALSTSGTTTDSTSKGGIQDNNGTFLASNDYFQTTGNRRFSLSTTTTVHVIALMLYTTLTGATYTTDSIIQARRIR